MSSKEKQEPGHLPPLAIDPSVPFYLQPTYVIQSLRFQTKCTGKRDQESSCPQLAELPCTKNPTMDRMGQPELKLAMFPLEVPVFFSSLLNIRVVNSIHLSFLSPSLCLSLSSPNSFYPATRLGKFFLYDSQQLGSPYYASNLYGFEFQVHPCEHRKKVKFSDPWFAYKIFTLLSCHKKRVERLSLNTKVTLNITIAYSFQKQFIVMGIHPVLNLG